MGDTLIGADDVLLRISEVEQRVGLGRTTIYKRMGEGTFPAGLQLGGGVVRWRRSDLARWLDGLPAHQPGADRPPPVLELPGAPSPGPRRRGRPSRSAPRA